MEACEIVADLAVFAFNSEGVRLADKPSFFRQPPIGPDVIRRITQRVEMVIKEHVFQRFSTTTTNPAADDVAGISVNSQPHPDVAVFFPT